MNIFEILFDRYSLGFFIHLLVMVLFFLQDVGRRKHFKLRFLGGLVICLTVCYFFPNEEIFGFLKPFFVITFLLVCLFLWFCFDMRWKQVLFYCAAMYAVQNLSYHIYAILCACCGVYVFDGDFYILLNYGISFAICIGLYYFFVKKNKMELDAEVKNTTYVAVVLAIFAVVYGLNSLTGLSEWDKEGYLIIHFTLCICCMFLLFVQFGSMKLAKLRAQEQVVEQILHMKEQQLGMSKDMIEMINLKCHDMKYQIAAIRKMDQDPAKERLLREMEKEVMIYDSVAKTGNEALDVILTEKSLYCEKHHISLAYMVDGEKLKFMSVTDVYSLFSNALDNAIECVSKIEDEEKRIINLNVYEKNGLLSIHMENCLEGALKLDKGVLQTTKEDADLHGYGILSMKHIADKYEGAFNISVQDGLFCLDIVINAALLATPEGLVHAF